MRVEMLNRIEQLSRENERLQVEIEHLKEERQRFIEMFEVFNKYKMTISFNGRKTHPAVWDEVSPDRA